ncbi:MULTISPECIES: 4'-phosphopantetheinyl transferase family protein [Burkholderia]|uniref:4'-phosphopantetheinyl transferase family protein n=1 Tax=Burkholderia TaxID=32008 RepID=UPI00075BD2AD|nr:MULTISPECIES: 4'-phosphopantetheinyl transferase superfamily protein [Burkholderia]AOJ68281.1 4'-phosphopantetheinyl transferase [Burkholderia savannae]KVG43149.1 4'-phosphopantetheinyl transferase [Burkholderia sp. MSMB0265]KVG79990.1 4'-phosphopantetheinyl transferase [Burkholderia sp. MSMB2040]KVG91915.1 4'-phosphopantetheinyl transferase [Burkholderia sp. MSMB2042]KVG97277.1 4'-phosphopantetheinyl transferase [Burkholderia sp. MSMB2041]
MRQPTDAALPFTTDAALPFTLDDACRAVELSPPAAAQRAGVRLVRLDFDFDAPRGARTMDWLSDDERERASRFVRADDALRSASTRAALRGVIGAALGVPPAELRIVADAWGRPRLAPAHAALAPTLDFNVSHSGAHALIAWSRAARVGVDIEAGRAGVDWSSLGRAVFAPADAAAIAMLPAGEREAAFYRVWAAKEAFLKALGTGIGGGLTAFSVLGGASPPRGGNGGAPVVGIVEPNSPASGVAAFEAAWLDAPAGYAACVAWRRAGGGTF